MSRDNRNYTTSDINVATPYGGSLTATLAIPNNSSRPGNAVIITHGLASSRRNVVGELLETHLPSAGIATLRIDFYGHGDRHGKPLPSGSIESLESITFNHLVQDMRAAVDFMQNKGYTKLGILGTSLGALPAIHAAAEFSAVKKLALRSGLYDWNSVVAVFANRQGLTPRDFHEHWQRVGSLPFRNPLQPQDPGVMLGYSINHDAAQFAAYTVAPQVQAATLIMHGAKDPLIPLSDAEKLAALMGQHARLEKFPDANHGFDNPADFSRMADLLTDFLKRPFW